MLLLTGKQSKFADEYTQDEIGIPGLVLMERAALKVAEHVEHLIRTGKCPSGSGAVLAVAGMGNNGADALAATRILSRRGIKTKTIIAGDFEKRTSSMGIQMDIAERLGVHFEIVPPEEALHYYREYIRDGVGIVLDGLFGVGLTREITGGYKELIKAVNETRNVYKIGVDVPSGIDCGTGRVLGCAVKCDETVTFGELKYGLVIDEGREYAGEVYAEDIGIEKPDKFPDDEPVHCSMSRKCLKGYLPYRDRNSNKGTYGKILIVAGNDDIYGAAYLSAAAAYGMGAGLVKVFTSEKNRDNLMKMLPEAMVSCYTKDSLEDSGLTQLGNDIKWADVIVCGPGIGCDETSRKILETVVSAETQKAGKGKTLILDADAINIAASDTKLLEKASESYKGRVVITPHMLEMSRISGESIEKIREDRGRAALNLAEKYKIAVVLKDARTHSAIWDCDLENLFVNLTGNSGMSKGGSGDVLTGIMAAFYAGWRNVFDQHDITEYDDVARAHFLKVAAAAVMLHGLAGDKAAEKKGQYGMLAGDIIDAIKEVI